MPLGANRPEDAIQAISQRDQVGFRLQALQKAATEVGVTWLSAISSAPGKQGHVSGAQANALTASRKASTTKRPPNMRM
ncbi:hypothetical protein [Candidatus Entotheonella palauensis]|uniref:hypothetical protein n=1 Tax=Candidatus Entotheonella palauensis TaxID=93172 RepID=UPI000B7C8838|nr:hypothetical protein [Candidatus Entotheonella palauensis]